LVSKRSLNEGGVVWRDRVRQSTKKKFLPTSDVLNRGNEGGTGVQMFLDEPETKEGQFLARRSFRRRFKSQPVNLKTHRLKELLRKLPDKEETSSQRNYDPIKGYL
jgi:hypothetical protein